MKVSKKKKLTLSYCSIDNIIILLRKESSLGHIATSLNKDWRFPKSDCNNRQAINYIKNVKIVYPDAKLFKV